MFRDKKSSVLIIIILIMSFCLGALSIDILPKIKNKLIRQSVKWDLVESRDWSNEFQLITINSSEDDHLQRAYVLKSEEKKPLLISLHTWSGDFSQTDPLAKLALKYKWNYIHPDFRGANNSKNSCLSSLVITDIDDAIDYAINNFNVDVKNIYMVGVSGGGYVALGSYLKSRHKIKAFLSWVPISDLSAWYKESLALSNEKYANDILACTSSEANMLNKQSAINRSPLYWDVPPETESSLEIYAGINDGHAQHGSVPISHSLLFFNYLIDKNGFTDKKISSSTIINLLTRNSKIDTNFDEIEGRGVIYQNKAPKISLTIFDGRHEMLPEYTFERLIKLSQSEVSN